MEVVRTHIGTHIGSKRLKRKCKCECRGEQKKRRLLAQAREIQDPLERKEERERIKAMSVRPQIPHNPMINAGAIMVTSLVYMDLDNDVRFDKVRMAIQDERGRPILLCIRVWTAW